MAYEGYPAKRPSASEQITRGRWRLIDHDHQHNPRITLTWAPDPTERGVEVDPRKHGGELQRERGRIWVLECEPETEPHNGGDKSTALFSQRRAKTMMTMITKSNTKCVLVQRSNRFA